MSWEWLWLKQGGRGDGRGLSVVEMLSHETMSRSWYHCGRRDAVRGRREGTNCGCCIREGAREELVVLCVPSRVVSLRKGLREGWLFIVSLVVSKNGERSCKLHSTP